MPSALAILMPASRSMSELVPAAFFTAADVDVLRLFPKLAIDAAFLVASPPPSIFAAS